MKRKVINPNRQFKFFVFIGVVVFVFPADLFEQAISKIELKIMQTYTLILSIHIFNFLVQYFSLFQL